MHPEITSDLPGICSECGMNLIPAKKKKDKSFGAAQEKHAGHRTRSFLIKFWISLALTIPVILYSGILKELFGVELPGFPGSKYLPLIFGSVVFFYGGWVFIAGAWRELRGKSPGMMTLIGLAVTTAYLYSVVIVFLGREGDLFWELSSLITIMLLGHWMEMRAVGRAQGALKELSKLLPDTAEIIIQNSQTKTIPLSELKAGDIVLIRPGGRVPADGAVIEGESDVNEAMITGESAPAKKIIGNEVIGGTINGDGALKVKILKIGEATFLAGVMRLVEEAQASKSRLQLLSDKAARILTFIAIGGGVLTFLAWMLATADLGFALERLVAVLVIACPHALGLAVPLVAAISTTMAASRGFLVRQRLALEMARNVDVVLFDKTGTLTKGEYGVNKVTTMIDGYDTDGVLRLAASVDSQSEHFAAKAIVAEARKRNLTLPAVQNFQRLPGRGVAGEVDGKKVMAGGESLLAELNIAPSASSAVRGQTLIYVVVDGKLVGTIALADLIRDESRQAIVDLKKIGVEVAMITGDSENVAQWVAGELGIDQYFAKVLPQEKSAKVKTLQQAGKKVAMVGDGINDAPALVQADLGVAIGAGTNVAIESAGIVLVKNDPRDIVKIIKLSRATYSKMMQNLFWATGYNVVALPLAAGVLYTQGILLQPALAALFMSLSTVIVAVNAALLKGQRL